MTSSKKCRLLSSLDRASLSSLLDSIDTVLSDCDGVIYKGNEVVPRAAELYNKMSTVLAKRVVYITNNCTKTRQETADKLRKMDFPVTLDTAFHAGYLTALYLKNSNFKGKVYVVGGGLAVEEELKEMGINCICNRIDLIPDNWSLNNLTHGLECLDPEVNCVVVGFDYHLSYAKIMKAANYLQREDAIFLATDRDPVFPIKGGVFLPGTGPLVTSIEVASGKVPVTCGKPNPSAFEAIKSVHPDVKAERTLMVGDRCGLQTLLVGTGVHSLEDVRRWEEEGRSELVPDFYVGSLGEMAEILERNYIL